MGTRVYFPFVFFQRYLALEKTCNIVLCNSGFYLFLLLIFNTSDLADNILLIAHSSSNSNTYLVK